MAPLMLMRAKDQSLQKYCTPVMFTRFFCALLGFHARKFPAKSGKKQTFIVDQKLYIILGRSLAVPFLGPEVLVEFRYNYVIVMNHIT